MSEDYSKKLEKILNKINTQEAALEPLMENLLHDSICSLLNDRGLELDEAYVEIKKAFVNLDVSQLDIPEESKAGTTKLLRALEDLADKDGVIDFKRLANITGNSFPFPAVVLLEIKRLFAFRHTIDLDADKLRFVCEPVNKDLYGNFVIKIHCEISGEQLAIKVMCHDLKQNKYVKLNSAKLAVARDMSTDPIFAEVAPTILLAGIYYILPKCDLEINLQEIGQQLSGSIGTSASYDKLLTLLAYDLDETLDEVPEDEEFADFFFRFMDELAKQ